MTLSGRFFLPGPVEVHPDVMAAMQRPMIGHRTSTGFELAARVQAGMQQVFQTRRPVMLATGSATAMMEAAIRSGVRERLLAVVGGTFGERFAMIAERCGKEVVRLHVPRGSPLEPALLAACLDGPPVDAVTLVHSETSTGVLEPVAELLPLLRKLSDAVTIVDAVTSIGGIDVPIDDWNADFVVAGSQKALGLPPGLCFGVASERFLERARTVVERGFYLDVVAIYDSTIASHFPQTPALPVVNALECQLARIAAEGLEARWARHRAMRERIEQWVESHGRCTIVAPSGRRSDTVTAFRLRDGLSANAIATELAALGWQVAVGLDHDTDRMIRIGHMGDLLPEQLDPLFDVLLPRL